MRQALRVGFLALLILALSLIIMAEPASRLRAQTGPSLTMPFNIAASTRVPAVIPVVYDSDNNINAIIFSLDYDETCLAFDETDVDGDGIPDAINFLLSPPFRVIPLFESADIDGELDLAIVGVDANLPPIPNRTLLEITLTVPVTCFQGPGGSNTAEVVFSDDPSPDMGRVTGNADSVLVVEITNPGVTVSQTSLTTTEAAGAGRTATFTVVLDTQPTANVTIDLSSDNTNEGTVSTGSLTFTPTDWDVEQTVTVTGVDDFGDDGDVPYSIVIDPAVSEDENYNDLNPDDVSVTNIDNDDPPPSGGGGGVRRRLH